MKRLFVAIDLNAAVLERLEQLRDDLAQNVGDGVRIKWTDTPQMHVTLKFLGDTPTEDIAPLGAALDEIADRHAAFEIHARGIGCFPRPDDPRVLWVGFDDDSVARLQGLHREIDSAFEARGLPPEERSFVPHITVGRVKSHPRPHLDEIAGGIEDRDFGDTTIGEILLYESMLGAEGATHEVLRRFELS